MSVFQHPQPAKDLTIGGDDYLATVESQRARALATLERIRALHSPDGADSGWCAECDIAWPCPTIDVLS